MNARTALCVGVLVLTAGATIAEANPYRRRLLRTPAQQPAPQPAGQQQQPQQPAANVNRGELNLATNNSQQQIELVIGPATGQVKVVGINGGSEQNFSGVNTINLRTGTNLDVITFQIRTPNVPQINVDTGLGDSDVKFLYEIPSSNVAQTRVNVLGGPGNDKVAFEAKVLARTFNAQWVVRSGSGTNEVVAKTEHCGNADATNVILDTVTGAGFDKLAFETTTEARRQDLRLTGSLGEGEDNALFKFDGVRAATTKVQSTLDLGGSKDQSEMIVVSRGGRIEVNADTRGGSGDDVIKTLLEGTGDAEIAQIGGTGDDYLDIEFSGVIGGRARQLAETGDDFLKYVVTGPRRAQPTMDGGAGFDQGLGFGRVTNIEEFDRQ
ncbi:MAG TPA: hypothetical protein VK157_03175 [Phycisphaerales bacterium]|nr:hypothetical protein [Phycisphaerales bacterium]